MKEDSKQKNINSCGDFREYYDNAENISSSDKEHLQNCSGCRAWVNEVDSFEEILKVAPQFDVSENLTQKILSDLKTARVEQRHRLKHSASIILFAGFLYILLFADSLESIWGLGSWVIGIATLWALKFVVCEPGKRMQQTG